VAGTAAVSNTQSDFALARYLGESVNAPQVTVGNFLVNFPRPFQGVIATFTPGNQNVPLNNLQSLVDFGDGSPPVPGRIGFSRGRGRGNSTLTVSASHQYLTTGLFQTTVAVGAPDQAAGFGQGLIGVFPSSVNRQIRQQLSRFGFTTRSSGPNQFQVTGGNQQFTAAQVDQLLASSGLV